MRIEVHYRWRYFDAARRRTVTTLHHCPASAILHEHPDAKPLEHTLIERQVPETAQEAAAIASRSSTSAWLRR